MPNAIIKELNKEIDNLKNIIGRLAKENVLLERENENLKDENNKLKSKK